MGTTLASLAKLAAWQDEHRADFYAANLLFWETAGAPGTSDEVAMTGDGEGAADIADSQRFLAALLSRMPRLRPSSGLDAGAGVGRVTKHLLLRHCRTVHLVDASDAWSTRSRRYLGKKLVKQCTFTKSKLEEFVPRRGSTDLIRVQWVLQYLTDADAVKTLRSLKTGLSPHGVLVIKENRPYLAANDLLFQVDTPGGEHARYDITRPDAHHRQLFQRAGMELVEEERGAETNFWVLR